MLLDEREQMTELAARVAKIVAPVFVAQGWTWWDSPDPPPKERIAAFLMELLEYRDPDGQYPARIGAGRFLVLRGDAEDDITIYLEAGYYQQGGS